jgi:hypothetical protein
MSNPTLLAVTAAIHQITRPLCTILVVATYCGLAAAGVVSPEMYKDTVLLVVGFWFAQRSADRRATDGKDPA